MGREEKKIMGVMVEIDIHFMYDIDNITRDYTVYNIQYQTS